MKSYKPRVSKSLNKSAFKNHQDFINAVDDICGGCEKENCSWHDLITSYRVWKKSHNYFNFDCFKGVENGKHQRNGKNGKGEELDNDNLSVGMSGQLAFDFV